MAASEAEIVDDWQVLGASAQAVKTLSCARYLMVSDLSDTLPGALVHPGYPVLRAPYGKMLLGRGGLNRSRGGGEII